MSDLTKFDHYLADDGPAALIIREHLMPVEGEDGVLFPATFAAGDGFPGGYNIDGDPDGSNVCLIDTVGSQANRIEPLFAKEAYRHLIPQIAVRAGEKEVSILDAGHRAGDALFRCSELQEELHSAFVSQLGGDDEPLARIAPTSLVFGVWDSRDTQAKLPRVVASTIRAFDVRVLKRGAVYIPPVNYDELGVFSEEEKAKAEGDSKSPLAKRGFVHNPASGSHGGVIATGGIRRDATLNLAAVRLLKVRGDSEKTTALQRYILGISLTAFTSNPASLLRQGCLLVLDPAKPRVFDEVYPCGKRNVADVTHDAALEYATAVAKDFDVAEGRTVDFDKERAKKDVAESDKKASKKKTAKKTTK